MENTLTSLKALEPYSAPSMKWTPSILLIEMSTIMMLPVLCVMSGHVALSWWYLQGMTVLMAGPKSIMGTWWLHTGTAKNLKLLSVLTGMPSRFQGVTPATMVHYCTWFRQIVDFSQNVLLITRAESSHAQCAQNNLRLNIDINILFYLDNTLSYGNGRRTSLSAPRKQNNNWNASIVQVYHFVLCISLSW